MTIMRDHGGDLDAATQAYGGGASDWLDLSTGINPCAYPMPPIPAGAWTALPTQAALGSLAAAAASAYGASVPVLPVAGAQAAIQLLPRLAPPGRARVLAPTYNEHRASLESAGWRVEAAASADGLAGADLAVLVNPNNPDGRRHTPETLRALAGRTGLLVVDESFADPYPDLSLAPTIRAEDNVIVLRSFGKFYGLAGLRLGFVVAGTAHTAAIREMAGPWSVSGPAIAVGTAALGDADWRRRTTTRLERDAARLDRAAAAAGWRVVGGTCLFRLYETPDAAAARDRLARARVWPRIFPYSKTWMRLGLPGDERGWAQVEAALAGR